ncbi:hypothetical protein TNCV_2338501 [Trichonephila clavipes]|nr:hypothetical protein TNCV_2338501 [Trichonephila clavipes]
MDVCKCIVPSPHGCTLNSRRAASPLMSLVEGEEREAELVLEIDAIGNVIENVVDLARQVNLEVDSDNVQERELLGSLN